MNPQKFRKKPVEIEAIQFDGWSNAEAVQTFAPGTVFVPAGYEHRMRYQREYDRSNGNVYEENAPAFLVIHTLEGDHRARSAMPVGRSGIGAKYSARRRSASPSSR